jgi:uncharacterized DUF497 family protein
MDFHWDAEKDLEIQEKHGISFQEIRDLIERRHLLAIVVNRSPEYPGQKALLVRKGKVVFMVPFEIRDGKRRLITAFYSEFFTKKYLRLK